MCIKKRRISIVATKVKRLLTRMFYKRWDEKNKLFFWRCSICFNELRSRNQIHWYHKKPDYKLLLFRCRKCWNGIIRPVVLDYYKLQELKNELQCEHCFKEQYFNERCHVLENITCGDADVVEIVSENVQRKKRKRDIPSEEPTENQCTQSLCPAQNHNLPNSLAESEPQPEAEPTMPLIKKQRSIANNDDVDKELTADGMEETSLFVNTPFEIQTLSLDLVDLIMDDHISPYSHYLSAADENLQSQWDEKLGDLAVDPMFVNLGKLNTSFDFECDCGAKCHSQGDLNWHLLTHPHEEGASPF